MFAINLTNMEHGSHTLLWETYSLLSSLGFMGLLVSVPTVLAPLVHSTRGQQGYRTCLLPCVSTPPRHVIGTQIRHSFSCTCFSACQESLQGGCTCFQWGLKNFWDCWPAMPWALSIDVHSCLYSNVDVVLSEVILSQTWGGIIIPCMDGTNFLLHPSLFA